MPIMPGGRPLKKVDNASFLNAIRADASIDYRNRVPVATQANLEDQLSKIWNHRATRNEFVSALVNQIGEVYAKGVSFANPLKNYKRAALSAGDTIEEVQVGLAQAYVYDPDRDYLEKVLFGRETPEVQSSFHKITRQEFYKITIDTNMLKRAFIIEGGLSDFVAQLMAVPATSDEVDEFEQMMSLFRNYWEMDGFFKVNVPDVITAADPEAAAKTILQQLRAYAATLPFVSRNYNAAGMPVKADPEDLILFTTPEVNAALDVQALAAVFNIDYAQVPYRVEVIPASKFDIPGLVAVLTTRDFFVVADTLYETTQQNNAAGLIENYFLHHHEIISASRFVPAILFTHAEETTPIPGEVIPATGLTVEVHDREDETVTDVERGQLYSVQYTVEPSNATVQATILSLEGATSEWTYLTQSGSLMIGPNEDAETLTLRGIIEDSEEGDAGAVTAEVALTVTGDYVKLWPNKSEDPEPPASQGFGGNAFGEDGFGDEEGGE